MSDVEIFILMHPDCHVIYSDRLAVHWAHWIRFLFFSGLVKECTQALNKLARNCSFKIVWVPGRNLPQGYWRIFSEWAQSNVETLRDQPPEKKNLLILCQVPIYYSYHDGRQAIEPHLKMMDVMDSDMCEDQTWLRTLDRHSYLCIQYTSGEVSNRWEDFGFYSNVASVSRWHNSQLTH